MCPEKVYGKIVSMVCYRIIIGRENGGGNGKLVNRIGPIVHDPSTDYPLIAPFFGSPDISMVFNKGSDFTGKEGEINKL